MTTMRIVLGFVLAAFLIVSSFMHSVLGWRSLSGQLRGAHAPEELVAHLALGWHLCSAAMFTFGVILIFLYAKFLRDRATPFWVAQSIALFYVGYGIWAQVQSHNSFFAVMFIVPGLLLLFAASSGVTQSFNQ